MRCRRRAFPALAESKNLSTSIAIWRQIARGAEQAGWSVTKAICALYREKYELSGPDGTVQLGVAYDGKHMVTALHLDKPAYWPLACTIAETCLLETIYTPIVRRLLAAAARLLTPFGWRLVSATESEWRLLISIVRNMDERIGLEINFDKQGLATTVRPLKYSNPVLIEEVREALQ